MRQRVQATEAQAKAADRRVARVNKELMIHSLSAFQNWATGLRRLGMVSLSNDRILELDNAISMRFCLGAKANRPFIGVQRAELQWFQHMPWLHACAYRGSCILYLVADEIRFHELSIPAFAIAMATDTREKLALLKGHNKLEIREISITREGRVEAISREPLVLLDFFFIDADHNQRDIRDIFLEEAAPLARHTGQHGF